MDNFPVSLFSSLMLVYVEDIIDMEIDKNWMKANRGTSEYMARIRGFIEFALSNPGVLIRNKMCCPCKKSVNIDWLSP